MIDNRRIYDEPWYYTIELEQGRFTKGHRHSNVSITRELLRQVNFESQSCIDIGTQEGMLPVLMKKAGAKNVVAYDRWSLAERIERVKTAYREEFQYIHGKQLTELPSNLQQLGYNCFDVVVFSGVLYHLINPLGYLAISRSFCRNGGIFLIETAAIHSQTMSMHFNAAGKLFGGFANYFLPTSNCLDYFLRLLRLKPLNILYLGDKKSSSIRIAVLCRAVSEPIPLDTDDSWICSDRFSRDLANEYQIHWANMESDEPIVPVSITDEENLISRGLYSEIEHTSPATPSPDDVILRLDSTL